MKPVTDSFIKNLESLENVRAIREDYEGARRAKERRIQLSGESLPADEVEVNAGVEGMIELEMKLARLSGSSIAYDSRRGALTGFKKPRHSAHWDLIKVEPGWYKILVTYGCSAPYREKADRASRSDDNTPVEMEAGGTFTIAEETGLIADISPPVTKTVVSTGSWDKLVTRNIGRIKLTGTTTRVKLEVVTAKNLGIMYLHSLKLIPDASGDAGSQLAEDASQPKKLRDLRDQYRVQVEGNIKQTIEAYIRELKLLEEGYANESKLEEAVAVRSERMRVLPLLDDPAALLKN